jgi:hypothetical protein
MDTTVTGNTAMGAGTNLMGNSGGICITGGNARLINTTVSGNTALGSGVNSGHGGGLGIYTHYILATVELINTTISNNTASSYGGGLMTQVNILPSATTLKNSIIANNSAPAFEGCYNDGATLTSLGYNLEDGDTCHLDQPTDLPNTDPLLGPLMDNGGPTRTHAPLPAGPAVDASRCPDLSHDQRGFPRPVDYPNAPNTADACDIGAVELQPD